MNETNASSPSSETPDTFADAATNMHGESESQKVFDRVDRAIAEVRAGRMVILVDDEDRENEGDLCMAAELVRPDDINFMAKWGRGLICVTLTEEQVARLELPMMAQPGRGGPPLGTAFTVSIEARTGVTTGISATDRAHTIRVAASASTKPDDLVTPGHVFPLRARRGGVLVRTGQTEGSVDLARLAGLTPAGVICEIMNDDGTMARMPDLERFAAQHGLMILSIADLIQYRIRMDRLVRRVREAEVRLDITGTTWRAVVYEAEIDKRQVLALVKGDVSPTSPVLVRMHAGSTVADVFASTAFEGGHNLRESIRQIEAAGSGIVVYFPPRGDIGTELVAAESAAQKEGNGAVHPVIHEHGIGAQVLANLGARKLRILTNNPRKLAGLAGFGLEIVERVPVMPQLRGVRAGLLQCAAPMSTVLEGTLVVPKGASFALVSSRFNAFIVEKLVEGARDAILRHGGSDEQITFVRVPGAWEMPLAVAEVARKRKPSAIIALGAVIRGSTPHFDYVAGEAAKGVASVQMETGVPVSFGILTTDTIEQAVERAGTKAGNKGFDAGVAAIEMVNVLAAIREGR